MYLSGNRILPAFFNLFILFFVFFVSKEGVACFEKMAGQMSMQGFVLFCFFFLFFCFFVCFMFSVAFCLNLVLLCRADRLRAS